MRFKLRLCCLFLAALSGAAVADSAALPAASDTSSARAAQDGGDEDALKDLLGSLLACQLGSVYLQDLPQQALYTMADGQCRVAASLQQSQFGDDRCSYPVQLREQSLAEFCLSSTDKLRLGDGSQLASEVTEWLLTPGPRLAITLPRFDAHTQQPYLGSLSYRETQSDRGLCSLEMRVYTPQPGATGLRPLLAFHGGSWSQRGGGFVGLESLVAHFTSRGMVVFVPFYRLVGDKDGPEACRGFVAEDLIDDAQAALDWVLAHGADYGADAAPVALFGQSAGGYLASSLAVSRAADIDAALLMYPPTDVAGFVANLQDGSYSNARGVTILERFLDLPQAQWGDIPARLKALSPAQQVRDGVAVPPLRIIHGRDDDLVLPNQSAGLCEAIKGGRTEGVVDGRVERVSCGNNRELVLIDGAQHALEVCALGLGCKAGDLISALAVEHELQRAYDWLATVQQPAEGGDSGDVRPEADGEAPADSEPRDDEVPGESSASGGGAALYLLLLLGFARRQDHPTRSLKGQ